MAARFAVVKNNYTGFGAECRFFAKRLILLLNQ